MSGSASAAYALGKSVGVSLCTVVIPMLSQVSRSWASLCTRISLGVCLSRHGQHDRAVACLKQAWSVYQELNDVEPQARTAKYLGEALWAQARAEHHQAAPDATSCGGISAASADTLQEAETWLRTALDLAMEDGTVNIRMEAQMHLACVAMFQGNENEAVELLSQHLQGWVDDVGPKRCAGCGQVRGEDAPMLSCDGCRVARCVYARCYAHVVRHRLPCLPCGG